MQELAWLQKLAESPFRPEKKTSNSSQRLTENKNRNRDMKNEETVHDGLLGVGIGDLKVSVADLEDSEDSELLERVLKSHENNYFDILLTAENIPEECGETIMSLAEQAVVKHDVRHNGDEFDIRGYVKVMCVAWGQREESRWVEGEVEPGTTNKNKAVGIFIMPMQEQMFVELVVSIINKAVGVGNPPMQELFVELVASVDNKAPRQREDSRWVEEEVEPGASIKNMGVGVCILPMQDMFVGLGASVGRNKVVGASILPMLDKFVELSASVKNKTEDASILFKQDMFLDRGACINNMAVDTCYLPMQDKFLLMGVSVEGNKHTKENFIDNPAIVHDLNDLIESGDVEENPGPNFCRLLLN